MSKSVPLIAGTVENKYSAHQLQCSLFNNPQISLLDICKIYLNWCLHNPVLCSVHLFDLMCKVYV